MAEHATLTIDRETSLPASVPTGLLIDGSGGTRPTAAPSTCTIPPPARCSPPWPPPPARTPSPHSMRRTPSRRPGPGPHPGTRRDPAPRL